MFTKIGSIFSDVTRTLTNVGVKGFAEIDKAFLGTGKKPLTLEQIQKYKEEMKTGKSSSNNKITWVHPYIITQHLESTVKKLGEKLKSETDVNNRKDIEGNLKEAKKELIEWKKQLKTYSETETKLIHIYEDYKKLKAKKGKNFLENENNLENYYKLGCELNEAGSSINNQFGKALDTCYDTMRTYCGVVNSYLKYYNTLAVRLIKLLTNTKQKNEIDKNLFYSCWETVNKLRNMIEKKHAPSGGITLSIKQPEPPDPKFAEPITLVEYYNDYHPKKTLPPLIKHYKEVIYNAFTGYISQKVRFAPNTLLLDNLKYYFAITSITSKSGRGNGLLGRAIDDSFNNLMNNLESWLNSNSNKIEKLASEVYTVKLDDD